MNQKYKDFLKTQWYAICALIIIGASFINDLGKEKIETHPMPTWVCAIVIAAACVCAVAFLLNLYLGFKTNKRVAEYEKNSAERLTAIQALDAADVTVAKSLRDFARLCVFPSNSVVMGDDVNRQISEFMNGIATIIETKKMPPEKQTPRVIAPKNLN